MATEPTQEGRALWLMLVRQGGWWTVKSIVAFWQPTFAEYEIQELVGELTQGGHVMRREMVPGQLSYCVTSECKPLPGVSDAERWRSVTTHNLRPSWRRAA